MFKGKKIIAIVLVWFLSLAGVGYAATLYTSSASYEHVNATVSAAKDGDTVVIPSGTATWNATISTNKAITIQGAGRTSTVITAGSTSRTIFNISGPTRITSIGFYLSGSHTTGMIKVSTRGWRVDNCDIFHTVGGYGIWASAPTEVAGCSGLIDNNTFTDARILAAGADSSFAEQNKIWAKSPGFGTVDAIYIEDNTHIRTVSGNILDANRGGKYVARFNTIYNSEMMTHAVQSAINRGTRSWEIYGNQFISNRADFWKIPVFMRAGEGLIFNNTVTGTWNTSGLTLDSRRAYDAVPNLCNGSQGIDENTAGESGWLCRDQPGAGADTSLTTYTGTFPNYVISWKKQAKSPIYAWGNTYPININQTSGIHIEANRDYFDGGTWGIQTSASSPFNGTRGTGMGIIAYRPETCSTGVGYWATDQGSWNKSGFGGQGVLYKCTSNNTWGLYYTPYTYPHPMRNQSLPLNSSPSLPGEPTPPSGVRIVN